MSARCWMSCDKCGVKQCLSNWPFLLILWAKIMVNWSSICLRTSSCAQVQFLFICACFSWNVFHAIAYKIHTRNTPVDFVGKNYGQFARAQARVLGYLFLFSSSFFFCVQASAHKNMHTQYFLLECFNTNKPHNEIVTKGIQLL